MEGCALGRAVIRGGSRRAEPGPDPRQRSLAAAAAIRAVHVDMKGVPPTFKRLLRLLKIFRHAGFNAVLMEWEDAFPWSIDTGFRNETAFSPAQVCQFHERAKQLGLAVLPLVQCLGHMETPLRLEKYRHLRERPEETDVLNVLAPGARDLVWGMIDDVLALTPECRFFFLGGDEAWSFGQHADTRAYIRRHGKPALYLQHVAPLCERLRSRGIRPVLWHDMMVGWSGANLRALASRADLCVWAYHRPAEIPWSMPIPPKAVGSELPVLAGGGGVVWSDTLARFQKHGLRLWGAGAYKCSTPGWNSDLPDFASRVRNFQDWLAFGRRFGLQGIVATGWSRNSTQNVQYVPVDAALDTLIACGRLWSEAGIRQWRREDSLRTLAAIGELGLYERVVGLMGKLTRIRENGWSVVVRLRELLALAGVDPRRREAALAQRHLCWLKDYSDAGEMLRLEAQDIFRNLVEWVWIERYFGERLGALHAEYADLQRHILRCRDLPVRKKALKIVPATPPRNGRIRFDVRARER